MSALRHWPEVPVLYSFRRCPYAMRARLAVAAAGVQVELREIVLRNKPAHMLELSPKGTVPVLWLPNGEVLEESLDILHWALRQRDPLGLQQLNEAESAEAQALVQVLDGPFKRHLDRYKYPERYSSKEADFDRQHHKAAGLAILQDWSQRIARHGNLIRADLTWVDLAVLPFVRQFRIPEPEWFDAQPELSALTTRLAAFVASPLFESVMLKWTPWTPGDTPVRFPA